MVVKIIEQHKNSNFVIVKKDSKYVICENVNGEFIEIFDDFDMVDDYSSIGLIDGSSNYFIAKRNGEESIYEYKDGKFLKRTNAFKLIGVAGLIEGISNYFYGKKK